MRALIPFTCSRMFRDRFRHVSFETCWSRVPFCTYAVRIASMILRTARFLCVLYAEICVNSTAVKILFTHVLWCSAHSGLVTPSGLTSIPAGMETPDIIELRKRKNIEEAMESGAEQGSLYTVLQEKRSAVGASMMGSAHVYELPSVRLRCYAGNTQSNAHLWMDEEGRWGWGGWIGVGDLVGWSGVELGVGVGWGWRLGGLGVEVGWSGVGGGSWGGEREN